MIWSPSRHAFRPSGATMVMPRQLARAPEAAHEPPSKMAGTVDLIAQRFVNHAANVVKSDPELQRTVGYGAGQAVAQHVAPLAVIATTAIVVAAGAVTWAALR